MINKYSSACVFAFLSTLLCVYSAPNGYFQANGDGTIDVVASSAILSADLDVESAIYVGQNNATGLIYFGSSDGWKIGPNGNEAYFNIQHTDNPATMFQVRSNGWVYAPQATNDSVEASVMNLGANDGRYAPIATTNASGVTVSDIAGYYSGTDVEDVLAEIGAGSIDDAEWSSVSHNLTAVVTGTAYTLGTNDWRELHGSLIIVQNNATITVPNIGTTNWAFSVIVDGAYTVSVDPDGSDIIRLDGTNLSAGDKATSSSASQDLIQFRKMTASTWFAISDGNWTDGN